MLLWWSPGSHKLFLKKNIVNIPFVQTAERNTGFWFLLQLGAFEARFKRRTFHDEPN